MNRMTIVGRLGSNAELKHTPTGTPVMELSVADNQKKGEIFITNWFKVVIFGKAAERWAPFCTRGAEVWCEGTYERREYTDRGGEKKRTETLNASYFRVTMSPSGQQDEGPSL